MMAVAILSPEYRGRSFWVSDQPFGAQADMAGRADDQVIMHRDPQSFARFGNLPGQVDIGAARRRIAARMIMHHPTTCFIILKCKHFF